MRKCSTCGESFNEEISICPGCGAFFSSKDDKKNTKVNVVDPPKSENGKDQKSVATLKKEKISEKVLVGKSLSNVKLVYLIIVLLVVGSLLLLTSGIFDSPTAVIASENQSNDPHAGIDLSSLEQIKELESKVEANKTDLISLLQLAHLLNDSGFKEKAVERYRQYLKIKNDEPDVWVDMGVCYYELGKNNDAINYMEKAIKLKPDHQIAHLNIGIVNFSSGNKDKAKEYWKKAVAINPGSEVGKRAEELINQH